MNVNVTPQQRRRFCRWYLALGSPGEAARRAGIPPALAEDTALELLHTPAVRRELAARAGEPPVPLQQRVIAGLARLAFAPANDAVRLAFDDCPDPEAIAGLDLFHVTSVKRDKNCVEIRLADRQRAMEQLLQCAGASDASAAAAALLDAISAPGEEVMPDDVDVSLLAQAENGFELVAGPPDPAS